MRAGIARSSQSADRQAIEVAPTFDDRSRAVVRPAYAGRWGCAILATRGRVGFSPAPVAAGDLMLLVDRARDAITGEMRAVKARLHRRRAA
jgi:hypothetical protein